MAVSQKILTLWDEHYGPCQASDAPNTCRGYPPSNPTSKSVKGTPTPKTVLESRPGKEPDEDYKTILCPTGQTIWLAREKFLFDSLTDAEKEALKGVDDLSALEAEVDGYLDEVSVSD